MGFPIRRFTDQSLFAAPRDLSQRTTSFIASQRQGIHRIPLRHLSALIINAHPLGSGGASCTVGHDHERPVASNASGSIAVNNARVSLARRKPPAQPDTFPLHDVRQPAQRRRLKAAIEQISIMDKASREPRLVEPDGIEPTTSCLQSMRSPN